ncbi:MAG TPA: BTAD domain-containing putative transcriptional regulator [Acidimicrobiales bacterium]|nr:BTAD domain-containing putative transcriptional regulator [Acidimicrobiales bacterium]
MTGIEPDLHLSILGPVRARRAGADVALGGRRQKSVLVRLAIVAGDVVPVDRLIGDLWGGEPPASAANTLQSYVSNLRRELGTGNGPVIERIGDGYRISREAVGLASARFEALVAQASGVEAGQRTADERIALLDDALALWRGQAVADFADEPWARGAAVRLDELRLAAEEVRFDLLLDAGRHAVAVGELSAAVDAHPLRERFTAQLVLALYRCGRQSEALRAYDRTRAHLGDELGLDPSPDLANLADQVLRHDPALDLAATTRPAPELAAAAPTATAAATAAAPTPTQRLALPPAVTERRTRSAFVGRSTELDTLQQAWRRAVEGDHRLAVITGEPGMGKTRLAQVFARSVHETGGQVLWGRCTVEDLVAYQPAVEALRTALRSLDPERAHGLVADRPALRVLLPDDTGTTAVGPGRAERYELFEAYADLLDELAVDGPVLLVIDDIQWADQATLGLLDHLLHDDRVRRVLVVATMRRPAGRATAEVDRLLADLRRDGALDAVGLAGMSADDVASLLDGHGVHVEAALAGELQARTGGNPFFVEALAGDGERLAHQDPRDLPESVRDLIDLRVGALDAETARVLTAAAVGGLRVELDHLAAVTELGSDDLLDAVDAAIAVGLLADDEELGWVTFPHALVRQAMIARTTRNREARLHLRFADALEADRTGGQDHVPAIADHLLRAGRLCPPDRAGAAAVAAGRRALGMYAAAEADEWAERAAQVLATAHDPDSVWALQAEADLVLEEANRRLGRADRTIAALGRVLNAARRHTDPLLLARAAQERALINADVGFHFGLIDEELIALLAEVLDQLDDDQVAERVTLLAWASVVRSALPDEGDQKRLAREAEALAATLEGRPDIETLVLLALRLSLSDPATLEERLVLGPEMYAAALASGWSDLAMLGLVLDVSDALEAGRTDDARVANERLRSFIEPLNRPGFDAFELFQRAALEHVAGNHEAAEALSAEGAEVGLASHGHNAMHARGGMQTMLARDLGTAGGLVEITRAMAAEYPDMPVWRATHAIECLAAGLPEEAADAAAEVFSLGLVNARDTLWATMITQLAEACWLLGDAEQCAQVAAAIAPDREKVAVTGFAVIILGPLARPYGLALAGAGDLDGAYDALSLAIDISDRCGFDLWAARARMERALVADQRAADGDADQAHDDRAIAADWAQSKGVHLALGPRSYPGPT